MKNKFKASWYAIKLGIYLIPILLVYLICKCCDIIQSFFMYNSVFDWILNQAEFNYDQYREYWSKKD